jgi:hypothetical protein
MDDVSAFARTADDIIEADETPTREELLKLIEKMQSDWVKLNEFLNRTAIYYSWCSDYERRLNSYNNAFHVLKLKGRGGRDSIIGGQDDPYILPTLQCVLPQDQTAAAAAELELLKLRHEVKLYERQIKDLQNRLETRDNTINQTGTIEVRYASDNTAVNFVPGEGYYVVGMGEHRPLRVQAVEDMDGRVVRWED